MGEASNLSKSCPARVASVLAQRWRARTRLSAIAHLSGALASIAVTSALADRKPTWDERSRIETKLKELGYARWNDVEFDEERNAWEVDNARAADGKEYDLKLNPQSLDVISRRLDD
ncbi:MAG: PepSY domain-containing protein [Pseudomonadota bacterium]